MNSTSKVGGRGLAILAAILGLVASVAWGAPVDLVNGAPVTEISGGPGGEKFYRIEVPENQDQLEISISGGTGDVDLYVRRGSEPTTINYDYRPFKVGNDETVVVEKPAAGAWYILLKGYNSYAGVTLVATYSGQVPTKELSDGVPVEALSDATNGEQFFKIEVPADRSGLEIRLSGGVGDADLYVRQGDVPTTTKYDYRPYILGNDETVTVKDPAAGTWHIMIKARKAYENATLVANLSGGAATLANDVPVSNLAGRQGSEVVYRIEVPAGQTNLDIKLSGNSGDADLYVKFGARPTTTDYDYRPFIIGNNESVAVSDPAAGSWYIMVRGYSVYEGATLRATYGEVVTLKNGSPVSRLSGTGGSETFFKIEVPVEQGQLLVQLSGGAGNADLYIRRNSKPTTATWDDRSRQSDNTESIAVGNPQAGTWYIMLKGTTAYSGLTLQADYRVSTDAVAMKNDEPVAGISGAASQERFYKIEVPQGQETLMIRMSGGTGDADLYVKFGAMPKPSSYDYRPYLIGNEEAVDVRGPKAGTWYVMVRGYQAFSGITLVARYAATATDDATVLTSGMAVSGISGTINSEKFYKIEVPADQARLEIVLSGNSGDADLYVRRDVRPTTKEWDYRPYTIGSNEKVTVNNPRAGVWHIMLRGQSPYASATLKATCYTAAETAADLVNDTPVKGLSGTAGDEAFFKIEVPAGQASLEFAVSGGTGDVDLYVRKGSLPAQTGYDYKSAFKGNDEKVEVTDPAAATWYVMLLGQQAYSGVTLTATYGVWARSNDFTADRDCVALWRFEDKALVADDIGSNLLDNHGVAVETTDVKEGTGCANFRAVEDDWMTIVDSRLSADFPTRSGGKTPEMSMCFWMKPRSFPYGGTLISKYLPTTNSRSWRLYLGGLGNDGYMRLTLGLGTGNNSKRYDLNASEQQFPKGRWYHVGFTYNDADKSFRIRVWDAAADALVYDYVGKAAGMAVTDAPLILGGQPLLSEFYDGLLDEMVVFKDILTTEEIDQIREGRYGSSK